MGLSLYRAQGGFPPCEWSLARPAIRRRYPSHMLGLGTLTRVMREVSRDVNAARERDPAARGVGPGEILAAWPGVHALLSHRVAHAMHGVGLPLAPRMLAGATRSITGIEIHPAAQIGGGFFTSVRICPTDLK